jgi:aryl-alcohol dehydrogenase-like predicted oxidoreductase
MTGDVVDLDEAARDVRGQPLAVHGMDEHVRGAVPHQHRHCDEGLVRAIGMSNYELEDVERCHASREVDVVQVGLSLIDYLDDRA